MKKLLLISNFLLAFLLVTAMNVSAQEVYFLESFATNSLPDGWSSDNVAILSSSSIPNQTVPEDTYGAKMKIEDPLSSWLQMPAVNGVTDLSFWCLSKNTNSNLAVKIEKSTDGTNWTEAIDVIPGLDLLNTEDFQNITVPLNIDGMISIRIYVYAADGVSSKGAFYVDDIQLGKPAAAADDATLFSLSVDSILVEGFDFNVTSYNLEISHAVDYTVTAEANDPDATVVITQVADINGTEAERTATVVVTSEDQSTVITTTIVFSLTDYWYKDGFETEGLLGWERHGTFFDSTPEQVEPTPNTYPGVGAVKFTRGHPTGNNIEPGYLLSPEITNVGTLTFWAVCEKIYPEQELNVWIKTTPNDSTLMKGIVGSELGIEWQAVEVVINETTAPIQVKIEAICDINDESDSRIWIDDLLLTYYEGGGSTQVAEFNSSSVSFYPNPVENVLNLRLPENSYQKLEIFNMVGQKVMQETITPDQKSVNVNDLQKGVYFISFTGNAGAYTAKFIKE